jgi:hypothetical protein
VGSHGYIQVRINRRPKSPNFLFAIDKAGQEYFIRIGNTGLTQRQFEDLKIGSGMSVYPEDKCEPGKAWAVRDAVPW